MKKKKRNSGLNPSIAPVSYALVPESLKGAILKARETEKENRGQVNKLSLISVDKLVLDRQSTEIRPLDERL